MIEERVVMLKKPSRVYSLICTGLPCRTYFDATDGFTYRISGRELHWPAATVLIVRVIDDLSGVRSQGHVECEIYDSNESDKEGGASEE
jgi:hypothetical protein